MAVDLSFIFADPPQDNRELHRELRWLHAVEIDSRQYRDYWLDPTNLDVSLRIAQLEFVVDVRDGCYEGETAEW